MLFNLIIMQMWVYMMIEQIERAQAKQVKDNGQQIITMRGRLKHRIKQKLQKNNTIDLVK
jgi:hypothetical protein